MKKYKRFCALLITLLTVLTLLPFSVTAAGRIDKDAEVTLTVSCKDDGRPIKGTEFDIYLVADVEPSGELTITETFSEFNVDIRGENDSAWRALASTLEGYVLRDRITPTDTAVSDEDGNACFPSAGKTLKQGLYLVCGYRHSLIDHRYDPAPILVLLPARDKEQNIWQYDVTVNAKFEITDVGGDEDDDPIELKVLKVWMDVGNEKLRPRNITVDLLKDGDVYDTVVLNSKNNWRYVWKKLDDDYRWIVVEREIEGYYVEVTREGNAFIIKNSYIEEVPEEPPPGSPPPPEPPDTPPNEPPPPNLPQTGQLWWPVPVLAVTGLLFIIIGILRRKGSADER